MEVREREGEGEREAENAREGGGRFELYPLFITLTTLNTS